MFYSNFWLPIIFINKTIKENTIVYGNNCNWAFLKKKKKLCWWPEKKVKYNIWNKIGLFCFFVCLFFEMGGLAKQDSLAVPASVSHVLQI